MLSSLLAISFATMAITFNIGDAEAGKRINRIGKNGFCSRVKDEVTRNVADGETVAPEKKEQVCWTTGIMEGGKVEDEGNIRVIITSEVSLSSKIRRHGNSDQLYRPIFQRLPPTVQPTLQPTLSPKPQSPAGASQPTTTRQPPR